MSKKQRNKLFSDVNMDRPIVMIKIEDTHDDDDYGNGGSTSQKVTPRGRDNELRLLQDSLTTFFTPSTDRRSTKPVIVDGGTVSSDDDDKLPVRRKTNENNRKAEMRNKQLTQASNKPVEQPLSVDVDIEMENFDDSDTKSKSKLTDSLSPYFTKTCNKRRTVKKGEFLSLSGNRSYHKSAGTDSDADPTSTASTSARDSDSTSKSMSERRRNRISDIGRVVGRRKTQNSASAALFSSPEKDLNEEMSATSNSENRLKRPRTPKFVYSPKSERRMNRGSFLMRPVKTEVESPVEDNSDLERPEQEDIKKKSKKKKKDKKEEEEDDECEMIPLVKQEDKENIVDDGSIKITSKQKTTFLKVRERINHEVDVGELRASEFQVAVDKEPRLPRAIRLGRYEVKTWYSSPFPMEYIHVPILYMCDFCLKYMKTESIMVHHLRKCKWYHPPGTEIYRKDGLSVFEVDGNLEKTYCQNLCLLSKSFLDHKTLFYDVEPFLFYIVTKNDLTGCHFVGYFSKEKYSLQKFNLSCIVTIPCYQKQGFGRFLIDFSFMLSRREKMAGTPERPLSDLGRISYASYWRTALLEWLHENMRPDKPHPVSIQDITAATGIANHDIADMFDALEFFKKDERNQYSLVIDFDLVNSHWDKVKKDKSRIWLDDSCLKWTPRTFSPSKDNFRSPHRTPVTPQKRTPNQGNGSKTSTPSGVSLAAVGSTIKSGVNTRRRAPVGRNLKQKIFEEEKVAEIEADQAKLVIANSTASESESDSGDETARSKSKKTRVRRKGWSCKEPTSTRSNRKRDDSPDDQTPKRWKKFESHKRGSPELTVDEGKSTTGNKRSTTTNGNSTTGTTRKMTNRGKMIFGDDESSSSSSSSSSFDESDQDDTYIAQKGRRGKPQKGKGSSQPRRKKAAPKKGSGKAIGKVFPTHCGTTSSPKRDCEPITPCSSSNSKNEEIDVIVVDDAVEMNPSTSEVCQEKNEEEEAIAAATPVSVIDTGPSTSATNLRVEDDFVGVDDEDFEKTLSTMRCNAPDARRCAEESSASASENSDNESESDEEKKMDVSIDTRMFPTECRMSPTSSATDDSAASSPRPIGDLVSGTEDGLMNVGFQPDDDDESRFDAHSEENDGPPPLDMMASGTNGVDEGPPMLAGIGVSTMGMEVNGGMLAQEPDGYSTGEDEAPPQLSPNVGKSEQDEIDERESVLNRPPMAPIAASTTIDEEEKLYHQQLSSHSHHAINSVGGPSSLGPAPSSASSSHQVHMSSTPCQNIMTPQQLYSQGPSSVQQTTPGSAGGMPQIYNQKTPEEAQNQQKQTFMSPIQGIPSVPSVHSVHNNSMEMAGPSSLQNTPQQGLYGHDVNHQMSQMSVQQAQPDQIQHASVGSANIQSTSRTSVSDMNPIMMQPQQQPRGGIPFGSPPQVMPQNVAQVVPQVADQQIQQVQNPPAMVQQQMPHSIASSVPSSSAGTSAANHRSSEGSSTSSSRKRAPQQSTQQQLHQQQQHLQFQQQQMHQFQMQQMNFQQQNIAGYPAYPGYPGYPIDAASFYYPNFNGTVLPPQYYQNGMAAAAAANGVRMPPMTGAAAAAQNPAAWARYPQNGQNAVNPVVNQFAPAYNAQGTFPGFDFYPNNWAGPFSSKKN